MFTVKIETDGAAFEEGAGEELARILRKLADRVDRHMYPGAAAGNLLDLNGNTVCEWRWEA
jgi:hypothetical protein